MNLKHDDLQKDPPGGNHFTLGCEMDIGKSHPKNWTHRVKTSAFWYSQICFMLYLWTLSKHHRNLWLDKWSPKHFLPSDTHVLIVQGRFWVLNCLHSRESKPESGLSTGFWLAQRQWHELCALTALEMKRSRTLCRDMMYYDELRTKKWLVTLSHGKTVSPKVQQFQRTCWYYSQWYCTQLMNRQHESEH